MTDDRRLAALWALDEPPAQDAAFVLAALDRLARRRYRTKAARLVPLFVATIAVCWAIAPSVEAVFQSAASRSRSRPPSASRWPPKIPATRRTPN